VVKVGIKNNCN